MSLKNLLEYGKIGLGSVFTTGGIRGYVEGLLSRDNMQEALYGAMTEVTPEKLIKARRSLETALDSQDANYAASVGVILGASLVASGIYNLVKNYRSERT